MINYILLSEKSKKYLGVHEFLPGTKLERMNQFRMVNNKYQENIEISKYLSNEHEEKETKNPEEKKTEQKQTQQTSKNVQDSGASGNRRRRK
jgi:hypothetical protein